MKRETNIAFNALVLLMAILFMPGIGYSGDVDVEFQSNPSVVVTKARIVNQSNNQLMLEGQLYRKHKLLTVGHLHVYAYTKNGDMISDDKHRILNSTSRRGGSGRFPFRVSIDTDVSEIERIKLEYHRFGHAET
jgi:hypothetical protein